MRERPSFFFRPFRPVVLSLLALLAACTSSSWGSTPPPTSSTGADSGTANRSVTPTSANPAPSGNAQSVSIVNFEFSPATLSVPVGTKVTWTNKGSAAHTVTADQGAFDSHAVQPGASFAFTFTKAGTYAYHCTIHPSMKATVAVQ
jgi:plastocyanin